jgi:5-methylcytosine-specific restriction protein A
VDTSHGWRQDTERVRGRKLQRLRRELFDKEPRCRLCRKAGLLSLATIRDHIIPLAEGGTEDPANIQPICQRCSDTKTSAEARRGRIRGQN